MPESSVIRNDGIVVNALTGMGTSRDKASYVGVGTAPQLTQEQEMQLSQDVFVGRICSAKPDAATRKWCEVHGLESEALKAFNQYRDTVGGETEDEEMVQDKDVFNWAGYLANVHPGCAIVMDIDDGRPPSEPINLQRIKSVRSLQVLDPYKIYPDLTSSFNPFSFSHYDIVMPAYGGDRVVSLFDYQKVNRKRGRNTYSIHRSRVLRIPGTRIPPDLMLRNNGWDRSLIAQIFDSFTKWMSSYSDVGNLIHDYSLFVYSLKGLKNINSEGGESALRNRFQALRLSVNALGGAAIDLDEEKLDFLQRQFGGIPELMNQFRDLLIGASDIPHTKIFGESPSGLGATGESEEKTWANTVEEYQIRVFHPRLHRLYRLIFLAKDGPTNGEEPKDWSIKWLPLLQQTEEQRMAVLSQFVGALATARSAEIILPEEARKPFETADTNFSIQVDPELWQEKQEQEQQQSFDFGGFGGGFGGGAPMEEPPPEEAPVEEDTPEVQANQDAIAFTDNTLYAQVRTDAMRQFRISAKMRNDWIESEYRRRYQRKHGSLQGAFKEREAIAHCDSRTIKIGRNGYRVS